MERGGVAMKKAGRTQLYEIINEERGLYSVRVLPYMDTYLAAHFWMFRHGSVEIFINLPYTPPPKEMKNTLQRLAGLCSSVWRSVT